MSSAKSTGADKFDHYTDFKGGHTNGWDLVKNASVIEGEKDNYYCELTAVNGFPRLANENLPFGVGKSYEISILARGSSTTYGGAHLAVIVYGAVMEGNDTFKVTSHWEIYKFSFTFTGEGWSTGAIWISQALIDFGDSVVDVDNIHIQEI